MSVNSLPIESLLDFLINKKKINKFLPEKPDLLQNYFCLQLFEIFDLRMIQREQGKRYFYGTIFDCPKPGSKFTLSFVKKSI